MLSNLFFHFFSRKRLSAFDESLTFDELPLAKGEEKEEDDDVSEEDELVQEEKGKAVERVEKEVEKEEKMTEEEEELQVELHKGEHMPEEEDKEEEFGLEEAETSAEHSFVANEKSSTKFHLSPITKVEDKQEEEEEEAVETDGVPPASTPSADNNRFV